MEKVTINGKEYQLDIDKAKEQGLLKEDNGRVKSWKEFEEKYENIEGYTYATLSDCMLNHDSPMSTPNQLTPHEAKALAAFSKLLKLRRDWIGDWNPDWNDSSEAKPCVVVEYNMLLLGLARGTHYAMSFPTREMAEEFRETFRELLEEAKDLI